MTLSVLTRLAFFASLLVHSDGRAQCMSEPVIGESYFTNVQTISSQQEINKKKPELIPLFESPHLHSVFTRKATPDLLLPIQNGLVFWRSQHALRSLVNSSNDIELPLSFEWARSNFLLARWEGRYPTRKPTKIFPVSKRRYHERSAHDHVELVWSPSGFQLNFYGNRYHLRNRCSTPPAELTETISLAVHSHQPCLVLRPNSKVGVIPLFVILSNSGGVELAVNPNGCSIDAQNADQDNNSMHAKPDLRVLISN